MLIKKDGTVKNPFNKIRARYAGHVLLAEIKRGPKCNQEKCINLIEGGADLTVRDDHSIHWWALKKKQNAIARKISEADMSRLAAAPIRQQLSIG